MSYFLISAGEVSRNDGVGEGEFYKGEGSAEGMEFKGTLQNLE